MNRQLSGSGISQADARAWKKIMFRLLLVSLVFVMSAAASTISQNCCQVDVQLGTDDSFNASFDIVATFFNLNATPTLDFELNGTCTVNGAVTVDGTNYALDLPCDTGPTNEIFVPIPAWGTPVDLSLDFSTSGSGYGNLQVCPVNCSYSVTGGVQIIPEPPAKGLAGLGLVLLMILRRSSRADRCTA